MRISNLSGNSRSESPTGIAGLSGVFDSLLNTINKALPVYQNVQTVKAQTTSAPRPAASAPSAPSGTIFAMPVAPSDTGKLLAYGVAGFGVLALILTLTRKR